MRSFVIAAFALVVASALAAQTTYKFTARDTVRYHEVTESKSELQTPRGPLTITSSHDATIAILRDRGDTLKAWFEQLVLASASPRGGSLVLK